MTRSTPRTGKVYLVGAGPGDPGLLTRRAAELIASADVIVLDALASPDILALARAGVRIIDAGKRASRHTLRQEEINQVLIDEASQGHIVVRLKGGDPFVFGRGGEEAEDLRRAGIPFEIVPGISSAIAGPAYAGIPVTHRSLSTSVTLITGHESDESSGTDWEWLGRARGTLVFLMGFGNLSTICSRLVELGRSPSTPVAVVSHATTPEQKTVTGTLADVVARVEEAGLTTPALIIVGEVVQLHEMLNWFERRPLFGRSVVVTRARAQSSGLARRLEEAGARVLQTPTIEITDPDSWESLDGVLDAIDGYSWLVFTSTNGVRSFFSHLLERGMDARALAGTRVAAVGSSTAADLRQLGVIADAVPETFESSAILPLLGEVQGRRVALVRAAVGRSELIEQIRAAGGTVDLAVAYQTRAVDEQRDELRSLIEHDSIDVVTFTSSSTADNFFGMLSSEEKTRVLERALVCSIGPITSETLRSHGATVAVEAPRATIDALADAIIAHFESR